MDTHIYWRLMWGKDEMKKPKKNFYTVNGHEWAPDEISAAIKSNVDNYVEMEKRGFALWVSF